MSWDTKLLYQPKDMLGSRYEIKQVLSQGETSLVYLAWREDTGQLVVLKTIHDDCLDNAAVRQAFRDEARLWIDMDCHRNILEARWIEVESQRWFIESEYIEPDSKGRTTLLDYLNKAETLTLTREQVFKWSIQFCYGMEHLHRMGMAAHCDITPSNLIIGNSGILRISDFGLATSGEAIVSEFGRSINAEKKDMQRPERFYRTSLYAGGPGIPGTLGYIAPEIIQGQNANIRSDIYSFGIVLWQMASGCAKPPYTLSKRSGQNFPSPRWLKLAALLQWQRLAPIPYVNGPLWPIIQRCVAVKPQDRYCNFSMLRQDLESVYMFVTGDVVPEPLPIERTAVDWRHRGICLDNLDRIAEALECQNRAIELNPSFAAAWTNKARCASYSKKFDEELQCLQKALEIDPTFCRAWNNMGVMYASQNNDQQALACYEKAVEYGNKYVSPWSNKGSVLKRLGRHQEALDCLEKAIALNIRDTRSWELKAEIVRLLGQWQAAVHCYDHILIIDPLDYRAWYHKCEILKESGRYSLALRCACKLLSICPNDYNVSKLHGELVKLSSADNRVSLPGDINDTSGRHAVHLFNLGEEHRKEGHFAQALHCYDQALCLSSRSIEAWCMKSNVLLDLKRYEEGILCCDKAILLNRGSYIAWCDKGAHLFELGRYQECIEHCVRAGELNPKGAEAWFNRAQAHYAMQQHTEALECYRQFLLLVSSSYVNEISKARKCIIELEVLLDDKRLKDRSQQSVMSCHTVQLQQRDDPSQNVL